MASQEHIDRVDAAAYKLHEEYEIASTLVDQLGYDASGPGVALALSQAKRTQRCAQALVRALAALRDVT